MFTAWTVNGLQAELERPGAKFGTPGCCPDRREWILILLRSRGATQLCQRVNVAAY